MIGPDRRWRQNRLRPGAVWRSSTSRTHTVDVLLSNSCCSRASLMISEVLIRVSDSSEALGEVDVLTRRTQLHEYTTWTKEQHAALIFMLIKNREQIVLWIMQHTSGRKSCTTGNQLGQNPTGACLFFSVSSSVCAAPVSSSFTVRITTKDSIIRKECLCSPTGLTTCLSFMSFVIFGLRSTTVSVLTSDQSQDTLIGGCTVKTHLHRRSLHSRHVGEPIEDRDGDGNGNEEAANERPQVTPPRRRLLSHHLHRKQQNTETGKQHRQNRDDTGS